MFSLFQLFQVNKILFALSHNMCLQQKIQRRYLSSLMQFVVLVDLDVLVAVFPRAGIVPRISVFREQGETASKSFRLSCRIKTAPVTFLWGFVRLYPTFQLIHPLGKREIQMGLVLDATLLPGNYSGIGEESQRDEDN